MSSMNYYGLVFQFHQISGKKIAKNIKEYKVVINLKERNVGTKEKILKQGLAIYKNAQRGHRALQHTFHTFSIASVREIQEHLILQLYGQQKQLFSQQDFLQNPQVFRTRMSSSRPTSRNLMVLRPVHLFGNTSFNN